MKVHEGFILWIELAMVEAYMGYEYRLQYQIKPEPTWDPDPASVTTDIVRTWPWWKCRIIPPWQGGACGHRCGYRWLWGFISTSQKYAYGEVRGWGYFALPATDLKEKATIQPATLQTSMPPPP